MFLHSFGPQFKPWSDYARTIRAETIRQAKWSIDFSDFSLASARSDDGESEAPLVQYLRALYLREPLDLIIAVGAPAASFIQRHRSELFPTIPMIFTAVDRRRVDYDHLSENDTVVAVNHDFAAILKTILQVLPDTKTVAIVNGVSPNEVFWHEEIQRQLAPFANRVVLKWYDELPFVDILKDAAKLPPHSAILWHLMNVDAAGVSHEENESLNALASVASAPIFSYDGSFFEGALVGGPMFSVMESSAVTANVANRILSGERAGDIKTRPIEFAAPRFDWRQLQRWGISESHLPPGSTVYFREPTVWERYSWQIALIAAVILVQAGLISALLREHRRRQFAEVQSRQRMAELAHVNRFSTAGELTASIAHEINQPLGAILTNAETADAILKSPSPDIAELKDIVNDILQDDRRASEVIRRMRSLLKKAPFELKNLDLNDVVRETVEFLSSLAVGRKVELVSVITPDALPILGDRIQLQQVILNLVVNGIDAMKDTPSRKSHHQHPDFARRKVCRAIRVGSRTGHSRRQTKRGLRAVFHQQGGRHGHGAVHRAHHYRGAQWADMGKKSGSRRRVVPDQASSCPIVGDPWRDPYEADPTSAFGTFETCRRTVTMSVYRGRAEVVGTWPNRRE